MWLATDLDNISKLLQRDGQINWKQRVVMCRQKVVYQSFSQFIKYNPKFKARKLYHATTPDAKRHVRHQQVLNYFCLSQYLMFNHKTTVQENTKCSMFVISGSMNYAFLPWFVKLSSNTIRCLNGALHGRRFLHIREEIMKRLESCALRRKNLKAAFIRVLLYNVRQRQFECCYFTDFDNTKQLLHIMFLSSTYTPLYVSQNIPGLTCAFVLDSALSAVSNDPAFHKRKESKPNQLMRFYVQPKHNKIRQRTCVEAALQTVIGDMFGIEYADVVITRIQDLSWDKYDQALMRQRFKQLNNCSSFFQNIIDSTIHTCDTDSNPRDKKKQCRTKTSSACGRVSAGKILREATCDAIKKEMCNALQGAVRMAVRDAICDLVCQSCDCDDECADSCDKACDDDACEDDCVDPCNNADDGNEGNADDDNKSKHRCKKCCKRPPPGKIPLPKGWCFDFGGKYMHLMKGCDVIQSWCI